MEAYGGLADELHALADELDGCQAALAGQPVMPGGATAGAWQGIGAEAFAQAIRRRSAGRAELGRELACAAAELRQAAAVVGGHGAAAAQPAAELRQAAAPPRQP